MVFFKSLEEFLREAFVIPFFYKAAGRLHDVLKAQRQIPKKKLLRKVLFIGYSMSNFSFTGYILTELFGKTHIW